MSESRYPDDVLETRRDEQQYPANLRLPEKFNDWPLEQRVRWFDMEFLPQMVTYVKSLIPPGKHKRISADNAVNGQKLMSNWHVDEQFLRNQVITAMPWYRVTADGKLEQASCSPPQPSELVEGLIRLPGSEGLSWPGGIEWWRNWSESSYPSSWWFDRKDVVFFDALNSELCGFHEDNPLRSPGAVAGALGITLSILYQIVSKHGLRCYRLDRKRGVVKVDQRYVEQHGLDRVRFLDTDLKEFEDKDHTLCGLRPLDKVKSRELMRNYAEQCYKDDHSVAVTKVVDEIFEKGLNGPYNGRKYVGKLIRDIWPEDLPTGPKPGSHRQPDKKKQGQHVK